MPTKKLEKTEDIKKFHEFRSQIKTEIIRLAGTADKEDDTKLSGILYTIVGVLEGNFVNSFAAVCVDYIDFIKEVSRKSKEKVDPKKIN